MDEHDLQLAELQQAEREVTRIIRARRLRSDLLQSSLFSEPAWDMLLALLLAEIRQRRVITSEIVAAAHVPATTALRWLNALETDGLVCRRRTPLDGRKYFVELSGRASIALRKWVRESRMID